MLLNDGTILVISILIQVNLGYELSSLGWVKKDKNLQGWAMQPVSSESVSGESVGASPGTRNGDDK